MKMFILKPSHSWTYQALINDVLETGLNQVAINVEGKKKQFYDLVQMDEFWWKYRFSPALPDVAEAVNTELEECQRQEDEIKSLQVSFVLICKFYVLFSSGYHIKYTFIDHLKPFKQLKGVLN